MTEFDKTIGTADADAVSAMPVEDQLAVGQLVAQYAFRCDTAQYAGMADLFADDGVWDESVIGLPVCEGRDVINQTFLGLAEAIEHVIHIGCSHQLTQFDGDSAAGTLHLLCEGRFHGADVRIRGYYDDRYVRRGSRWLFSRRTLVEIMPTVGLPGS